jgi:hypothetical protein
MNINASLIQLIYNILSNNVETRDDWMLCIKEIHSIEMTFKGISNQDYFHKLFEKNDDNEYCNFSNVHTIKRLWQKVQEDFPHLRGITWEERQKQGGQYVVDNSYHENQLFLFSEEELNELAKLNLENIINNQ